MAGRKNTRRKPVKYYSPKRRAIYAQGDAIDHLALFEMHNWMCWICEQGINKYLRKPHLLAATIDHIIPLCEGGTHTWDNIAPAHALCNFKRAGNTPKKLPRWALSQGVD